MPADWGYDIGKWKENMRVGHRVGDKGLEGRAQGREQSAVVYRTRNRRQEGKAEEEVRNGGQEKGTGDRRKVHRKGV